MLTNFVRKYGNLLTSFSFFVAAYGVSRICFGLLHDPVIPESAKKLRKF